MTTSRKTPGTGRQRDRPTASPDRPKRKEHKQKSIRKSERTAERHKGQQADKDQQSGTKASRAAQRPAGRQRPAERHRGQQSGTEASKATKANIQMFHVEQWRTTKSYPQQTNPNREFVTVNREFVTVKVYSSARARASFGLYETRMKGTTTNNKKQK